jgi:hypothetical protein
MSVWRDLESLQNFVYKSNHREVLMRKKEWFEHLKEFAVALWFVPVNFYPTIEDARSRLKYLRENGPTPHCFSFAKKFSAEEYVSFLAGRDKQKNPLI